MGKTSEQTWHTTPQEEAVCAKLNDGSCPHDAEWMASLGGLRRSPFERDAERRIADLTTQLLNELDRLALRHDVDKATVEQACHRFSGPDLADCWSEYVGEAEL